MSVQKKSEEVIFTGNISVSHIALYVQEPDVTLFALYGNLVSGNMELINIICDFNQLNDLLAATTDGSEETIEKLSDLLNAGITGGETLDLTETGGLHFRKILFCLEHLPALDEYGEEGTGEATAQYIIRDFITGGFAIKVFEKMFSYKPRNSEFNDHQYALIIQFEFYQRFKQQKMKDKEALRLSGLKDKMVFMLASADYYAMKKTAD